MFFYQWKTERFCCARRRTVKHRAGAGKIIFSLDFFFISTFSSLNNFRIPKIIYDENKTLATRRNYGNPIRSHNLSSPTWNHSDIYDSCMRFSFDWTGKSARVGKRKRIKMRVDVDWVLFGGCCTEVNCKQKKSFRDFSDMQFWIMKWRFQRHNFEVTFLRFDGVIETSLLKWSAKVQCRDKSSPSPTACKLHVELTNEFDRQHFKAESCWRSKIGSLSFHQIHKFTNSKFV